MAVKHAFVSAIADDPTAVAAGQVVPSNWNADHVIDDATVPVSKLSLAATQRVAGRNTAGAGAGEEVTASQLLDWVSNTNGVLLTRTAGSWAALANVTTDNGDLVLAVNASPVAPSSGIKLFGRDVGGRPMVAQIGPAGLATALQPLWARNKVYMALPNSGTAGFTSLGATTTTDGTATQRNPASTNFCTQLRRVGAVSAATAASAAGIRVSQLAWWRGNAAGLGGFFFIARFNVSDAALVSTANMFVGMRNTVAAVTDVAPSTLTNILGVGCDSGDTTLQLYASGAAAQARASLGANFPVNTTNVDTYELVLFAAPNAASISYLVTRLNTGDTATGTISAGASLIGNTTFLSPAMWRSNGGTASAVGIDVVSLYIETDN